MRYTYSPKFPVLQFNEVQGLFFGGNFWDARSTGFLLQSPDAEQAQHPPVDTQEMGLPDTACIAFRLSQSEYRPLFETVWGAQAFRIDWPADIDQVCNRAVPPPSNAPGPVKLSPVDRGRAGRQPLLVEV